MNKRRSQLGMAERSLILMLGGLLALGVVIYELRESRQPTEEPAAAPSAPAPESGSKPPSMQGGALPLNAEDSRGDVRIAYHIAEEGRAPEGLWSGVDSLLLRVRRMEVEHEDTEAGCDDSAYLRLMRKPGLRPLETPESKNPPGQDLAATAPPTSVLNAGAVPLRVADGGRGGEQSRRVMYRADFEQAPRMMQLSPDATTVVLPLPELNALPTGFLKQLRLFVVDAEVTSNGQQVPVQVPRVFRTEGMQLAAIEGPVPVCNGDITALRFDAATWLGQGSGGLVLLEPPTWQSGDGPHAVGSTTAPVAVSAGAPSELAVPAKAGSNRFGLRIEVPDGAVTAPTVLRAAAVDLADRREDRALPVTVTGAHAGEPTDQPEAGEPADSPGHAAVEGVGGIDPTLGVDMSIDQLRSPGVMGEEPDLLYVPVTQSFGPYASEDPVFRKLMLRIGNAYDLQPHGARFERPIRIVLPAPVPRMSASAIASLSDEIALPEELLNCWSALAHLDFPGHAPLIDAANTCIDLWLQASESSPGSNPSGGGISPGGSSVLGGSDTSRESGASTLSEQSITLAKQLRQALPGLIEGFDAESLALYTWSSVYRTWLPDTPSAAPADRELIGAALDAAARAGEEIDADPFMALDDPAAYFGLHLDHINNRIDRRYLVTDTNHFCIKSLFADLNLSDGLHDRYEPLLDGALDDMCQTADGFGYEVPDESEVHCGGAPASGINVYASESDVESMIRPDGVGLRFRDSAREFFDDCDGASNAYCYDFSDFQADVKWAIAVWREAIDRDPDGGWTERFRINCIEPDFDRPGSNCSGPTIDIRIKSLDDEYPGVRSRGRNVTLDEEVAQDAAEGPQGRLNLRHRVLRGLGGALGLRPWAGPGTLMSYNGVERRNGKERDPLHGSGWILTRKNLCSPLTLAQQITGGPRVTDPECTVPETFATPGTLTTGGEPHSARLNVLTCTDVERVRRRIRDADLDWSDWDGGATAPAPLRCELKTDRTTYLAVEELAREWPVPAPTEDDEDRQVGHVFQRLGLDLDLTHCGGSDPLVQPFHRMEVELLGVDNDYDTNLVSNLYRPDPDDPWGAYEVQDLQGSLQADGVYTAVPLTLESRHLLEVYSRFLTPGDFPEHIAEALRQDGLDPAVWLGERDPDHPEAWLAGIEQYSGFAGYLGLAGVSRAQNRLPQVQVNEPAEEEERQERPPDWPALGLAIRTYALAQGGDSDPEEPFPRGYRSEYLVGGTGLLRAPTLTPVAAPIRLSLQDVALYATDPDAAVSVAAGDGDPIEHPLMRLYGDLFDSADLFPYVDDHTKKPSVGSALYLVLPPRADDEEIGAVTTMQWDISDAGEPFIGWDGEERRLWIKSVHVARGLVPTIADRELGDAELFPAEDLPDLSVDYDSDYSDRPWNSVDRTTHVTGTIRLVGEVPPEPILEESDDGGRIRQVWDLYHVQFQFAYPRTHSDAATVHDALDEVDQEAGAGRNDLVGVQDFYISISGPQAAFTEPAAPRVCVPNSDAFESNPYTIRANVRGLTRLQESFPDYGIEVQIHAEGRIAPESDAPMDHAHESPWTAASDLGDGVFVYDDGEWYNQLRIDKDAGYTVQLLYRFCTPPSAHDAAYCGDRTNWSEPRTLDTLALRFDKRRACPAGWP